MNILLIEDNLTIAQQLAEFLGSHGWQLDHADKARRGTELALAHVYDVILLDLNLPDGDGLEVCARIQRDAPVVPPILMLTARDSFEDKAAGFNRGADDYLTKPFDLRELALRCEALARRSSIHRARRLELGEITLDLDNLQAHRQGQPLTLTRTGFHILLTLAHAHPQPVSRSFLSHQLWGDEPPDSDALKSHIYALRQALDRPFDTALLHTVMNVGYRLEL